MKLTAYRIRTLNTAAWIIAGYTFISVLYSVNLIALQNTYHFAQFDFERQMYVDRPFTLWDSLQRSVPIGMMIGIITAFAELVILPGIDRRSNVAVAVLIRIVAYLSVTIPIVYFGGLIIEMMLMGKSWGEMRADPGVSRILPRVVLLVTVLSIIVALVITFLRLVSRKFGRGVMLRYLFGRYHHPRQEERIFMFLDMRSSTAIAEKLSPGDYHNFLNDVFYEISEPILEYRGEIYQYVGDEVVITWPFPDGIEQERCLRCFFAISAALERKNPHYQRLYGVQAKMKAGVHCGTVTTGEIGDLKTEIVFHGDAVNTTSRIQEMCNKLRASLLVSGDVMRHISLSDKFVLDGGGTLTLRGKEKELELYSIIRK